MMKGYLTALAIICAFAAGVFVSHITSKNKALSEEVASSKTTTRETVSAAINAGVVGEAVEQKIALSDSQALTAVAKAQQRLDNWQPPVVQTKIETKVINNETCQVQEKSEDFASPDSFMPFDIGTVRLLNAIRSGASVDSISLTDEESGAVARITVRYFITSDTEIARMYNELAVRHNALVDEVTKYQAAQAKRLQKK